MTRAALLALCLCLCLCLGGAPAFAACPDWLSADMAARGVPNYEIARMCGPAPVRSLAPASGAGAARPPVAAAPPALPASTDPSRRCVPLAAPACTTESPRPVGSPCWCALPDGGHAEGTIR